MHKQNPAVTSKYVDVWQIQILLVLRTRLFEQDDPDVQTTGFSEVITYPDAQVHIFIKDDPIYLLKNYFPVPLQLSHNPLPVQVAKAVVNVQLQ